MPAFVDLTGQRFARLLVIKRVQNIGRWIAYLCLCDCGNTITLNRNKLVTHNTKSCGCLYDERRKHALGWDHPDVYNPRRRELYAQKKAMGYVRVRDEGYYVRKRARARERFQENPEHVRELARKGSRAYRLKYPEKVVADNQKFREENPTYGHAWYELNKDARKVYNALYNREHPEVQRENSKRRRAAKLQAPTNDFTAAQWEEMKKAYGFRCVYCGRKMQRLTQDHITPLSKGGSHTASNVVPACKSCNSRKNNRGVLRPVQPMLFLISKSKKYKTKIN